MTKAHLQSPFVEAGMTDENHKVFPTFNGLMGTCKCWSTTSKNRGVSHATKIHCTYQFQSLSRIQLDMGQVAYADMHAVGLPWGKSILSEDRLGLLVFYSLLTYCLVAFK